MSLHVREFGNRDGALMVFLHGGGVSGWMWDEQVKYFTDYDCLVPDLPEIGLSSRDTEFSISSSAVKIMKLIEDRANGKDVIVIGFSLGAQVLVEMLSQKPDLVDYAIINSASVTPVPLMGKMIKPLIYFTFPLIKNRSFAKLQAKELYIKDDQFETYYQESIQMKPNTLVRVLVESTTYTLPEGFSKANGKILVTVGEKEKGVMKKSYSALLNSNQNCEGIVIQEMGHGVSLAKPELFNSIVEKWLNGVPFQSDIFSNSK